MGSYVYNSPFLIGLPRYEELIEEKHQHLGYGAAANAIERGEPWKDKSDG